MRGKNTIYINGRQYDAITGLAVSIEPTAPVVSRAVSIDGVKKPAHSAAKHIKRAPAAHHAAHRAAKSATLRRDLVKKPEAKAPAITARPNRVRSVAATSPAISRFASHPMAMKPVPSLSKVDLAPKSSSVNHTINRIHKSAATAPVKQAPKALSSRELKEKLIADKLAQIDHKAKPEKQAKKRFAYPRLASVMTASLAVVVLGGYLTYINMPNLSMRVAAAQAGVNAKFPDYHPAGYSFDGPIAYNGGEVAVKFQNNGGSNQSYTIRQKNSSWDSQAVLDNYVAKESTQYMTSSEQGLTIYTYKNKAAWVNGGVLYTIEGNAPLSNEQVLRIAGSM